VVTKNEKLENFKSFYLYRQVRKSLLKLLVIQLLGNVGNPTTLNLFKIFLKSPAVGNNQNKLYYRYKDLKGIFALLPKNLKVVELGQGSSTFLFLSLKNVDEIISLEENVEFLLGIDDRKLSTKILKVELAEFESIKGTKYRNSEKFILLGNFIYVDGPTLRQDDVEYPVNLDLLKVKNLTNKFVAVDCRSSTTQLLANKLFHTHWFLPSKSFSFSKSTTSSKRQLEMGNQDNTPQFLKKLSRNLIRTNLFWPRNFE